MHSDARTRNAHPKDRATNGAVASKVLILGLDGATFDVLAPLMRAGRMPNLARLVQQGASGILRSTIPPITPAAWTTFMTGRSPGAHGIIDFERYDVRSNALSFNTTNALRRVRTIWQVLGEHGYKVGCINVPMTYPPMPVNGFLISGFEAVSTRADFTYPPELKTELLTRWPDYTFKNRWRHDRLAGSRRFARNLAEITRSFHQGAEVLRHCGDHYGWDVMMIVFKMVDNLQHKVWRYIDPRTRQRFPRRCRMAENCFAELDVAIGSILQYAEHAGAHVFVMSDHGHGSLEGKAQPNLMLKQWDYLAIRQGGAQAQARSRKSLARFFRRKGRFAKGNFSLEDDLAVDFSRTRAVMHAGMAGFLYINLAGRQQTGIVDPADYEPLRDELKDRLEKVECTNPAGQRMRVFEAVHRPEELYGCERADRDWLPDLILSPQPGLSVIRKIRGNQLVNWIPLPRMEGTHRREGIFALHGPGVAAGRNLDTDIIHATPTVLAMLGVPVPAEMEGTSIADAFDPPLHCQVEHTPRAGTPIGDADEAHEEVYDADTMAQLTERLVDLGYLE